MASPAPCRGWQGGREGSPFQFGAASNRGSSRRRRNLALIRGEIPCQADESSNEISFWVPSGIPLDIGPLGDPFVAPSIFFLADQYFGVPARENFIGAYTPGMPGYVTIVPPIIDGEIRWMQLVPGQRRIFWNEVRFQPPAQLATTYWSAQSDDGADRRAEPDLTNATIGPSGQWKYYRASERAPRRAS